MPGARSPIVKAPSGSTPTEPPSGAFGPRSVTNAPVVPLLDAAYFGPPNAHPPSPPLTPCAGRSSRNSAHTWPEIDAGWARGVTGSGVTGRPCDTDTSPRLAEA